MADGGTEPEVEQPQSGLLGVVAPAPDLPDVLLPELFLTAAGPFSVDAEVVAVPFSVGEDGSRLVGQGATGAGDDLPLDASALLEARAASGAAGEVVEHVLLPTAEGPDPTVKRVLLVGVGGSSPADLRRAGAAVARSVKGCGRVTTSIPVNASDAGLRAFVEGVLLGSFGFTRRTTAPTPPATSVVIAGVDDPAGRVGPVRAALATARAGLLSRLLSVTPSNQKNPESIAETARSVAGECGLKVRVWDEAELQRDGFGGLIGVGQASATPPRLVQLGYTPPGGNRRTPHVVLVGKGITFDTGGLSIKPPESMANMKRDMTGAAVVLAVLSALPELGCPVRVTGLLALAENAVSGNAMRPGDVVRHYGGRTTEVTNTDAEGRLVLADALAYAVAELSPTVMVDVATLTGAVKVALGLRTGGLFATDDALADHLLDAGSAAGEPLWRLPIVEDYEERLTSTIADADNAGGPPGAITAALFLKPFTGTVPWAHLDIASVGDAASDAFEWSAGPTGFGARLLLHWLEQARPVQGVRATSRGRGKG